MPGDLKRPQSDSQLFAHAAETSQKTHDVLRTNVVHQRPEDTHQHEQQASVLSETIHQREQIEQVLSRPEPAYHPNHQERSGHVVIDMSRVPLDLSQHENRPLVRSAASAFLRRIGMDYRSLSIVNNGGEPHTSNRWHTTRKILERTIYTAAAGATFYGLYAIKHPPHE